MNEKQGDESFAFDRTRSDGMVLCRSLARSDELIADAWAKMRDVAVRKQLTVCIRAHRESALLRCDEERVLWVLTSLLGSAFDCTAEGGRVEVHSCLAGNEIRVSVHDTGRHLTDGERALRFEPTHGALVADARGQGHRLDIVRSIVSAHGGELRVERGLRSGTLTTFTLPRRLEPQTA